MSFDSYILICDNYSEGDRKKSSKMTICMPEQNKTSST